jgi:hypothetical protein
LAKNKIIPVKKIDITRSRKETLVSAVSEITDADINVEMSWTEITDIITNLESAESVRPEIIATINTHTKDGESLILSSEADWTEINTALAALEVDNGISKETMVTAMNAIGMDWITESMSWERIAKELSYIESFNYVSSWSYSTTLENGNTDYMRTFQAEVSTTFQRLADAVVEKYDESKMESAFGGVKEKLQILRENEIYYNAVVKYADDDCLLSNTKLVSTGATMPPVDWGISKGDNTQYSNTDSGDYHQISVLKMDNNASGLKCIATQSIKLLAGYYTLYLNVSEASDTALGTIMRVSSFINGEIATKTGKGTGTYKLTFNVAERDVVDIELGIGINDDCDLVSATIDTPYLHSGDNELVHSTLEMTDEFEPVELPSGGSGWRYVRDCLNGSTANAGSHWVEMQVFVNGVNIALGCDVISSGATTDATNRPVTRLTDGNTATDQYFEVSADTEGKWVGVDLGAYYNNLDSIKVWHYYSDGRTYYNKKVQVSNDKKTWTTIYDESVDGNYGGETSSGYTHTEIPTAGTPYIYRYIRDTITRQDESQKCKWTEIELMYGGKNVLVDKTFTTSHDISGAQTDLSVLYDGRLLYNYTTDHIEIDQDTASVTIDLGSLTSYLGELNIWHYPDGRTYKNHKIELSEDGETWFTIYDTKYVGDQKETVQGIDVPIIYIDTTYEPMDNTIVTLEVLDDDGLVHDVVAIPKFRMSDVFDGIMPGSQYDSIHPAFLDGEKTHNVIYFSKYENTIMGDKALCADGLLPAHGVSYDEIKKAIANNGENWHLSTVAEWAAVSLWTQRFGVIPEGNNSGTVLVNDSTDLTKSNTGDIEGVFNLVGNTKELVAGIRLYNNEIQIIEDNHLMLDRDLDTKLNAAWKSIDSDGNLISFGAAGALKVFKKSKTEDILIITDSLHLKSATTTKTAYSGIEIDDDITIPDILYHLNIFPALQSAYDQSMSSSSLGENMMTFGGMSVDDTIGLNTVDFSASRIKNLTGIGFRTTYRLDDETLIRYIRDTTNGSSEGVENVWTEIQAYTKAKVNVALGKVVTPSTPSLDATHNDVQVITNGLTAYSDGMFILPEGEQSVVVDLKGLFTLSFIEVWHKFDYGRTTKSHKLEVSTDGLVWTVLKEAQDTDDTEYGSPIDPAIPLTLASVQTPVPYRYVRSYMNGTSLSVYPVWQEIQVFDDNGDNVSEGIAAVTFGGGSLLTSGSYHSEDPQVLVDGLTCGELDGGFYIALSNTDGRGGYVTLDLGATHQLSSIKIFSDYWSDYDGRYMVDHKLEVSEDGITWDVVSNYSDDVFPAEGITYEVPSRYKDEKVRYIKNYGFGNSSSTSNMWSELQAFDSDGVNRALGLTVTMVPEAKTDYDVYSIATDGVLSTSETAGNWLVYTPTVAERSYLQLDLGEAIDIRHIDMYKWYGITNSQRTLYQDETEVSEDGVNWRVISAREDYVSEQYVPRAIDLAELEEAVIIEDSSVTTTNIVTGIEKFRYIRDVQCGNNINEVNFWTEFEIIKTDLTSILTNKPVYSSSLIHSESADRSVLVDGSALSDSGQIRIDGTEEYVLVDLEEYVNLDDVYKIKTVHDNLPGHFFNNHRIEISQNGRDWMVIHNTEDGIEGADGFEIIVNATMTTFEAPKYKYFRDTISGSNTGHHTAAHIISRFGIYVDGEDVTSTGTFTTDVTIHSAHLLADMINGTSTVYAEIVGDGYVQIELPEAVAVERINLRHHYESGYNTVYSGVKLEISEDGETWYTLYDTAVDGTYTETEAGKDFTDFPESVVSAIGEWVTGEYDDMSFEDEAKSSNSYVYLDSVGGWTGVSPVVLINGTSGGFTALTPIDGNQFLGIQGATTVRRNFLIPAHVTDIEFSFYHSRRTVTGGTATYVVSINGEEVGTGNPTSTSWDKVTFSYTFDSMTDEDTEIEFTIDALNPANTDSTQFFDNMEVRYKKLNIVETETVRYIRNTLNGNQLDYNNVWSDIVVTDTDGVELTVRDVYSKELTYTGTLSEVKDNLGTVIINGSDKGVIAELVTPVAYESIGKIVFKHNNASGVIQNLLTTEVSANGYEWTEVDNRASIVDPVDGWVTYLNSINENVGGRYFKFISNGNAIDNINRWTQIQAVSYDGEIISTDCDVIVSKAYNDSHGSPGVLTDGTIDENKFLEIDGEDAFVILDLGSYRDDVQQVNLFMEYTSGYIYTDVAIMMSDDGETWTYLRKPEDLTPDSSGVEQIINKRAFRYIRILSGGATDASGLNLDGLDVSLSEIEVYNADGVNVALGATLIEYTGTVHTTTSYQDPTVITNGTVSTNEAFIVKCGDVGRAQFVIDLGAVHFDIVKIKEYEFCVDRRTSHNRTIEISRDNINWYTISKRRSEVTMPNGLGINFKEPGTYSVDFTTDAAIDEFEYYSVAAPTLSVNVPIIVDNQLRIYPQDNNRYFHAYSRDRVSRVKTTLKIDGRYKVDKSYIQMDVLMSDGTARQIQHFIRNWAYKSSYYSNAQDPSHIGTAVLRTYDYETATWSGYTTMGTQNQPGVYQTYEYKIVDGNIEVYVDGVLLYTHNEDLDCVELFDVYLATDNCWYCYYYYTYIKEYEYDYLGSSSEREFRNYKSDGVATSGLEIYYDNTQYDGRFKTLANLIRNTYIGDCSSFDPITVDANGWLVMSGVADAYIDTQYPITRAGAIEVGFQLTDLQSYNALWSNSLTGTYMECYIDVNGLLTVGFYDDEAERLSYDLTTNGTELGTNHVLVTWDYDEGVALVYVNGVNVGTITLTNALVAELLYFNKSTVGCKQKTRFQRVYNRKLSEAEVLQNYNASQLMLTV